MADLQASDFAEFFNALHDKAPFPWQEALAAKVCAEGWDNVKVIDLPTASGKTACIDIALFALAVGQVKVPRRIFFVVDRRVVVNEAYLRMCKVRDALKKPKTELLRKVSEEFYRQAGIGQEERERDKDTTPLLVSEMRGGAFRDETWVKNPLQPTVVASTVDQVGSRLLFRGYGVSKNSWPMHAGLIANDALIFLDEAHCSVAFSQTLGRVGHYRGEDWASNPIQMPFHFVQMTATPSQPFKSEERVQLTDKDYTVDTLQKRLQAAKPTRLIKFKGSTDKFADELVKQAIDLAGSAGVKRAVIFVNRVKTAKEVYKRLREEKGREAEVELLIGAMRPVDRDDLYERKLKDLKSGADRQHPLTFVVSTQCLEVGADLDFDVLVSECASIDALQQRFGRLDRLGEFGRAQGAIIIGSWQIDPKQPDPVYGTALSETWKWLQGIGGENQMVNMGIEPRPGERSTVKQQLDSLKDDQGKYRLAGEDAPALLPAHVDMLVQTSPVPVPSPSVEFFLHGPKRGVPDVQVVWRGDLEDTTEEQESKIIALCPPSTREAMAVSINSFKKWFTGQSDINGEESDLEIGTEEDPPEQKRKNIIYALAWDGEKCERIKYANQVKPGQTLILKQSVKGWDELGHIPGGATIDVGDRAAFETRNAVSLRLHPDLTAEWPPSPALQLLRDDLRQPDFEPKTLKNRLKICQGELKQEMPREDKIWQLWPYKFFDRFDDLRRPEPDFYPGRENAYVFRARCAADKKKKNNEQVFLDTHLEDVEKAVERTASCLPEDLEHLKAALCAGARLHDYGKVDIRYQAWLRNGDRMAAQYAPQPIAKSGKDVLIKQSSVGLPEGFRHELLSLLFAEKSLEEREPLRDLILHLVASHHGRCRPFAPVVLDDGVECVSHNKLSICKQERLENASHHLGRGVPDRFWQLTSTYGWWGLAYLEALLRLADWKASEDEAAEVSNDV